MQEMVIRFGADNQKFGPAPDRRVPIFDHEIRKTFAEIISGLRRIDCAKMEPRTRENVSAVLASGEKLSKLVGEAVLGLVGGNGFSDEVARNYRANESVMNGVVGKSLAEIERIAIEETIAQNGGSVPKAARVLGVSPSTLYRKREGWMQIAAE